MSPCKMWLVEGLRWNKTTVRKVNEALSTIEGIVEWWTRSPSGLSQIGGTIVVKFLSAQGKEMDTMNMEVKALVSVKKSTLEILQRERNNGMILK